MDCTGKNILSLALSPPPKFLETKGGGQKSSELEKKSGALPSSKAGVCTENNDLYIYIYSAVFVSCIYIIYILKIKPLIIRFA